MWVSIVQHWLDFSWIHRMDGSNTVISSIMFYSIQFTIVASILHFPCFLSSFCLTGERCAFLRQQAHAEDVPAGEMGFWWGRGDRLRLDFSILDQPGGLQLPTNGGLVEIGVLKVTFTKKRIGYWNWFESLSLNWFISVYQFHNSSPINSTLVHIRAMGRFFSAQDMYALQDFKSSPAETIKAALAAGTDVACSPGVELQLCLWLG